MKTDKDNDPIEVFAGSPVEAGIVGSLIKDADIEVFLKDELMGTIAPWYVSGGGAGSVKVVVSAVNYIKAKSIVEGYYKNISSKFNKP